MKLVGALSSPYTRRVAITMTELGLPFEHEALSVFAELSKFKAYNPIVRAPSLLLDDGTLLLESNVIIDTWSASRRGGVFGRRTNPHVVNVRHSSAWPKRLATRRSSSFTSVSYALRRIISRRGSSASERNSPPHASCSNSRLNLQRCG